MRNMRKKIVIHPFNNTLIDVIELPIFVRNMVFCMLILIASVSKSKTYIFVFL